MASQACFQALTTLNILNCVNFFGCQFNVWARLNFIKAALECNYRSFELLWIRFTPALFPYPISKQPIECRTYFEGLLFDFMTDRQMTDRKIELVKNRDGKCRPDAGHPHLTTPLFGIGFFPHLNLRPPFLKKVFFRHNLLMHVTGEELHREINCLLLLFLLLSGPQHLPRTVCRWISTSNQLY